MSSLSKKVFYALDDNYYKARGCVTYGDLTKENLDTWTSIQIVNELIDAYDVTFEGVNGHDIMPFVIKWKLMKTLKVATEKDKG